MIYNYGFVIANDPFLWIAVSNIGPIMAFKGVIHWTVSFVTKSCKFKIVNRIDGNNSKMVVASLMHANKSNKIIDALVSRTVFKLQTPVPKANPERKVRNTRHSVAASAIWLQRSPCKSTYILPASFCQEDCSLIFKDLWHWHLLYYKKNGCKTCDWDRN